MLNKKDLAGLVQELNEQKGISLNKKETEAFIDSVVEGIVELSSTDKLRIAGLGDFETVFKEARIAYNPKLLKELKAQGLSNEEAKAQAQVEVPSKRSPKFKFAKAFKDCVGK